MPNIQIKEYQQRTDVGGPRDMRGASSDAFAGDVAANLRQAGKDVASVGEVIQRKEEQSELSDAQVKLSEAHAQFTNKLDDDVQKGTVNSDEFMQKYDEEMSKAGEAYGTGAGKQHFTEAAASLRAHFLEKTHQAQSVVAGERSKQQYVTSESNYETALMKDPTSLEQVKSLMASTRTEYVKGGHLPSNVADQLGSETNSKLTAAAIRGYAETDPKGTLEKIKAGEWDKSGIDGDTKRKLENEVHTKIEAKRVEQDRIEALDKKVLEEKRNNTMLDFNEKMFGGGLSTQEVIAAKHLSPQEQLKYIDRIHRTARDEARNDPSVENQIYKDIATGKISSGDEIVDKVGSGIDAKAANRLSKMLRDRLTPEGMKEQTAKDGVMREAEKTLRKDPMMGADPEGERRLNEFRWAFEEAWKEGRTKGKTARELSDPKSADYLGNMIPQYKGTAQEIMKSRMESLNKKRTEVVDARGTAAPTATPTAPRYKAGDIVRGYKFKGGDTTDKANWEKAK